MKNHRRVKLSAPPRLAILGEARTALDAARMVMPLFSSQLRARRESTGKHVIVVPGFGSDDRYTLPLRHYLNRSGHRAEGWRLGRNLAGVNLRHTLEDLHPRWQFEPREDYRGEGGVPYLCDRFIDRLLARHGELKAPITLIGWSLGGYLAREAARDLPDVVDRVITMGAPVIGGPKYTAARGFFTKRGLDLDWIEREIAARERTPISQPITAIYSDSDGVVARDAAIDRFSPNVTHIQVNAAHLGMGFNPTIWQHISDALQNQHPAPAKNAVA